MFLHTLREYTRTAHAAIESEMDILQRLRTREEYRTTLCRYLGFFEPMECGLSQATFGENEESEATPRSRRLKRDLAALGMTTDEITRLTRCQSLPPLRSPGAVWGCRYVIEGSALGGQIIYRLVRERFGIAAESGASFFAGDRAETGRRWRDFGIAAEAFAADAPTGERDAALESALATFHALGDWFRGADWESAVD